MNRYYRPTVALQARSHSFGASARNYLTPLATAASGGNLELVQQLLADNADPNERGRYGITALMEATLLARSRWGLFAQMRSAALPVIQELIAAGADPNQQDENGATALHYVVDQIPVHYRRTHNNRREELASGSRPYDDGLIVVQELLKAGADPNISDYQGNTPLLAAGERLDFPVARALIAEGAEITLPNNEGDMPIYYRTVQQAVRELQEHRAARQGIYELTNQYSLPPLDIESYLYRR
jgi:ankyrin repeat protein